MTKLPVFLIENHIADELPPELTYSTMGGPGQRLVGYVISDHGLKRDYQGVSGAVHSSSVRDDQGFFSVQSLIRCATDGLHGLTWEAAS